MANLKAEKAAEDKSTTEASPERKIANANARSDFFFKLAKLVGLSECLGDRVFSESRNKHNSAELVVIERGPAFPTVTVRLTNNELEVSESEDSARSSWDASSPVSDHEDAQIRATPHPRTPRRLSKLPGARRRRNKTARNTGQCKAKAAAVRALTPIPEISSVLEHNSLLPDSFINEDAKMESDSIRARTAIALARAQLQLSRPASYHRKVERSQNLMMMLPGELEECLAAQAANRRGDAPVRNNNRQPATRNLGATNHAIQQSQAMVVTLMAAREVISQRGMVSQNLRSHSASISTIDILNESAGPPRGLYKPGDMPPCPPPSIPLPELPSQTGPISRGTFVTPTQDRLRSYGGAYKVLPTEYRTDNEALQHIDILMQSLLVSQLSRKQSFPTLSVQTTPRENKSAVISASSDSDSSLNNFGARPRATSVSQPAPTRQASYRSQRAVRGRADGTPLTPALTPPVPTSPCAPARNISTQNDPKDVVGELSISAQSTADRRRIYPRPTLPSAASGDSIRSNKPAGHPPGIASPSSLRKRTPVNTTVPTGPVQGSPQRPVQPRYNYV